MVIFHGYVSLPEGSSIVPLLKFSGRAHPVQSASKAQVCAVGRWCSEPKGDLEKAEDFKGNYDMQISWDFSRVSQEILREYIMRCYGSISWDVDAS